MNAESIETTGRKGICKVKNEEGYYALFQTDDNNNLIHQLCDFIYSNIENFQSNGLAVVETPLFYKGERIPLEKRKGLIHFSGKQILACEYCVISSFDENSGLACVGKSFTGSVFGFVNRLGDVVIPLKYDFPLWFTVDSEGFLWLKDSNGKWGAMDEGGHEKIPFVYDDAGRFCYGLAGVVKAGKQGFIDNSGRVIIDFKYPFLGVIANFECYEGVKRAIITESWNPIRQYYIDTEGNRTSKVYNGIYGSVENEQGDRLAHRDGAMYLIDRFGNEIRFVRYGS